MVLHIDIDAVYLVAPKVQSRIVGYYHLSDHPTVTTHTCLNGAILVECKILWHMASSAVEAEAVGVFHNTQITIPIRIIFEAMDHPQPPTPIQIYNSTANDFIHDNIHQKRSKLQDRNYYWLRCQKMQQLFNFFGTKEATTKRIVLQSVMLKYITEKSVEGIFKIKRYIFTRKIATHVHKFRKHMQSICFCIRFTFQIFFSKKNYVKNKN